jgi:hypothetical protein
MVMDEAQILSRIEELVHEEARLYERDEEVGLREDERRRFESVQAGLDRCWETLQRRRASWEAGIDPDEPGRRGEPR